MDARIGKYVVTLDGKICGSITDITIEDQEYCSILGYSVDLGKKDLIREVPLKDVIAFYVKDEHLFNKGETDA